MSLLSVFFRMFFKFIIFTSVVLVHGNEVNQYTIPENFTIGVATSAFQIEGGRIEDGRGLSVWDTFIQDIPERIVNSSTADIASDSYHKFDKDLKALIDMKVNHYRFSISWTRIMPNGDNSSLNQKGIDYYNYVIDKLVENNITPMVSMVHFDLPHEFTVLGGLTNPEFVGYFKIYARSLFTYFGDRVKMWMTFNEPTEFCRSGYGTGTWPPGIKKYGLGDYLCIQNSLKAHAVVYRMYRKEFYNTQKGRIGLAFGAEFYFSATNDSETVNRAIQFGFGIMAHPIYSEFGGYPEIVVEEIANTSILQNRGMSRLPQLNLYWRTMIRGAADFIGINYYSSRMVETEVPPTGDAQIVISVDPSWKKAKSYWLFSVPSGLEGLLKYIRDEYNNVEVIITENGWSDDGELLDFDRVHYLRGHIIAVLNAIRDGCNVIGYTAWSLIDNFEWLMGYR